MFKPNQISASEIAAVSQLAPEAGVYRDDYFNDRAHPVIVPVENSVQALLPDSLTQLSFSITTDRVLEFFSSYRAADFTVADAALLRKSLNDTNWTHFYSAIDVLVHARDSIFFEPKSNLGQALETIQKEHSGYLKERNFQVETINSSNSLKFSRHLPEFEANPFLKKMFSNIEYLHPPVLICLDYHQPINPQIFEAYYKIISLQMWLENNSQPPEKIAKLIKTRLWRERQAFNSFAVSVIKDRLIDQVVGTDSIVNYYKRLLQIRVDFCLPIDDNFKFCFGTSEPVKKYFEFTNFLENQAD